MKLQHCCLTCAVAAPLCCSKGKYSGPSCQAEVIDIPHTLARNQQASDQWLENNVLLRTSSHVLLNLSLKPAEPTPS
jgi:hypothetical protein